jgi:hypothetical protein
MAWTDPASPEQFKFIEGLMDKKEWESIGAVSIIEPKSGKREAIEFDELKKAFLRTGRSAWVKMTRLQASTVIEILKSCPDKQAAPTRNLHPGLLETVPFDQGSGQQKYEPQSSSYTDQGPKPERGRYFIVDPFTKKEAFFKVSKNEDFDPPWIRLWAQASGLYHEITNPDHRRMVYDEILKDPINAMNEYGKRLGVCGRCGRLLTKKDSRLRGLGPDCAEIVGAWISPEDRDIMSKLGILKNSGE